jgi:hypothetical protein
MPLNSSPISKDRVTKSPDQEEPKTLPKKSFQDLLSKKKPSKKTTEETIFDLAKAEGSALPPPPSQASAISEQLEASSLLPIHMQELFEQMVDCIQLESEKGISTTTVMIEMENSLFDGSEIMIKHYDTAPHSFTIQLGGSSSAVTDFQLHLPTLLAALQGRFDTFQINLLPPYLNEFKTQSSVKKGKKVDKLKQSVHKVR